MTVHASFLHPKKRTARLVQFFVQLEYINLSTFRNMPSGRYMPVYNELHTLLCTYTTVSAVSLGKISLTRLVGSIARKGSDTVRGFIERLAVEVVCSISARYSRMNHSAMFFFFLVPHLGRLLVIARTNDADCGLYIPRYWHALFTNRQIPRRSSVCLREARA